MQETRGGKIYSGLRAHDAIAHLCRSTWIKREFGSLIIEPVRQLEPDYFELELRSDQLEISVLLRCFLLPVFTEAGVGLQLAYRWTTGKKVELERRAVFNVIELFDTMLKEIGAKQLRPVKSLKVEGDSYEEITIEDALKAIAGLANTNKRKIDANGLLQDSCQGTLRWLSPRTGSMAAEYAFRFGQKKYTVFLRWEFFRKAPGDKTIYLNYEFSSGHHDTPTKGSMHLELLKTLINQTSICLLKAGAVRTGSISASKKANKQKLGARKTNTKLNELTRTRNNFWPMAHEYNEAMQNLKDCVSDEEIRSGQLNHDQFGLPKVVSGNFAAVYGVEVPGKRIALRCFYHPVADQAERYRRLSRYVCSDDLSYTIDFHYLDRGVLVKGLWYPMIKMEWIEGESINSYIGRHLNNPQALSLLRKKFRKMISDLTVCGIAHGDLQHGNILIKDHEIILIDYDGMYVPDLCGFPGREKGHPNYQHPGRDGQSFGAEMDRFSSWVIDSALLILEKDSSFWKPFGAGDESLLFRRSDFVSPERSALFAKLSRHECQEIAERAQTLQQLVQTDEKQVPLLEEIHPVRSGLPDWMSPD
jgi:hypothetical protein